MLRHWYLPVVLIWVPLSQPQLRRGWSPRGQCYRVPSCWFLCVPLGVAPVVEHYKYMEDLKALESNGWPKISVPEVLQQIRTPLNVFEWEKCLRTHPDKEFSEYIIQGLTQGFRIGFCYHNHTCQSARSNMQSAGTNPAVVRDYLRNEVQSGTLIGLLKKEAVPGVHINRFGVIPKSQQPGKWRLIVDLSRPMSHSVNEGILKEHCSLRYPSVDDAVKVILALGPGTQLVKFDVKSAYRIVPVHPSDRLLLGIRWQGEVYVDTALPFGLRSAPKIFTAVADALQWILEQEGVPRMFHYLDDFLLFGAPGGSDGARIFNVAMDWCKKLGVPIADHKTEGPTSVLTFLGIEVDAVKMEIRLPPTKLLQLKAEIREWAGKESCTKRQLLSLIGRLQHACCVVQPGRTFLRRMIDFSTKFKQLHFERRLNKGFQSDLQWWSSFLCDWNGVSMMGGVVHSASRVTLTSDASGSWGCGAFTSLGKWFMFKWPRSWASFHITVKELLPIVLAVALWGAEWKGMSICCQCDNAAVIAILRSGSYKNKLAMHLVRSLFFLAAKRGVVLAGVHIPGKENGPADALSRNKPDVFLTQIPFAQQEQSAIPPELVRLLVTDRPDWTSRNWTRCWGSFLQKA